MKRLINEVISVIEAQIQQGSVNLVKVEDFESPIIYMEICKHFSSRNDIEFIANLEHKKFEHFINKNENNCEFALDYLENNGFVEDVPLTKFRNLAAEKNNGTTLLLLLGAEMALDKGSLKDFIHISMNDIVVRLKKNVSKWFVDYLFDIGCEPEKCKDIINNIYKDLFRHINVDAMKLSTFVDSLYNQDISSFDELVEYIYSTLNEYWNVPSILSNYKKPTKKAQKYISNSYSFINNGLNIASSKRKGLGKKLDKFAEKYDIDITQPFQGFSDYQEFSEHLYEFLDNKNIDSNRAVFINSDFGVITEILDLSIKEDEPVASKDTVIKFTGEPLSVYLEMILYSCFKFRDKFGKYPLNIEITVNAIRLSNCTTSDSEEESSSIDYHFENICIYIGGILDYIKSKGMKNSNISIDYVDGIDPFVSSNIDCIKSKIKAIDKWGENSEIKFTVNAVGESEDEKRKVEFMWKFSPYASWKNAFSLLKLLYNGDSTGATAEAPLLTTCSNMDDLIASESEDEFFIKLESIQCEVVNNYSNAVRQTFKDTCFSNFAQVHHSFNLWISCITENGFFSSIDGMNELIMNYTNLLDEVTTNYNEYSSSIKEKVGYILNIFNIISDSDFLSSAKSSEVIMPAYNPAMLEKIVARNDFIIYSFSELFEEIDRLEENKIKAIFSEYSKLATITQGVDVIPCGTEKLICKNVWGYYALYYGEKKKSYINNIELVPEECDNNADISEQSDIIFHHIWNYMKTFPSRIDGLNVAFIAPTEIQYVVEGLNKVSDALTKKKIFATINLKVICFGGSKNIGGYLKYWLNNYMNKDKTVTLKTYLQYISTDKCENELTDLLENQDLCFIYDILKTEDVTFDSYIYSDSEEQALQVGCQFPMTFIPDTIAKTHGLQRKVNISQVQFIASKSYTQLANRIMNPNSMDSNYKVMQVLELQKTQNNILNIAHEQCRWVVCEDKAIDRELLQTDSRRIIGFTTGEGCFGEYNVTVSAKAELLTDIKSMLKQKLIGKFTNWSMSRVDTAADYCINLTESFDGSRILKALNPYDYEIHNFLAYALTVKMLGIDKLCEGRYVTRTLINLDSYQHWFRKIGTRPDFMLIEIPICNEINDVTKPLNISIKIIECKMSINIDGHIEKAITQLSTGLTEFKKFWSPSNESINRRYWFTQLYRAIAFSVISISDNDSSYSLINSKIYNILNGDFVVDWSGDIYAFDLTSPLENIEKDDLPSEIFECPATLYRIGQIEIQKMLIPEDDGEPLEYIEMDQSTHEDEEPNDDATEVIEHKNVTPDDITPTNDDDTLSDENKSQDSQTSISDIIPNSEYFSSINDVGKDNKSEESSENEIVAPDNPTDDTSDISKVRILIGVDLKTQEKYYWEFGNKNLNNRHLLINGNSGCGKTYCIQGLLMDTALQGISSVVFDYTGGFTEDKLDTVFLNRMGNRIQQRVVYIEGIPINPFKKGTVRVGGKDYPEKDVSVANRMAEIFKNVYSFGAQQASAIYSAVMNSLNINGERMTFKDMATELEKIKADTVISKIRPFIDLDPFVQGEDFEWEHIRDDAEGVVYVIQFDGYGRDVQVLLTELLLWDIWNFSVKTGDESKPFILVMDEAQNLSHGEKSPSAKILTEGRKFGLSGWYATQFMKPQLSDDEIQRLQQAGQKLYFCPPDDGVETVAKSIDISPQGKKDWAERLKKLKKGECVTCGSMMKSNKWVKYPPRIIKVISLQERLDNE